MEVTVDKAENNVAKVQLNVPSDEFQKEYKSQLNRMRGRMSMKGFRPGKAPLKAVEKHHGEQLQQEIQQEFLRRAYAQAVEEQELRPISHPRVTEDDAQLKEDGSFQVAFEISLRPEVELPEYKGLAIESELEPVMDQNIDEALEELKRQQSKPEPAEGGLTEQGFAMAKVEFVHGEQSVFDRDGLRVSPLSPPPGVDPEAFKEALTGQEEGAIVEVEMTIPENVENEEARDQPGTCRVTLGEAYNLVPPTDEELFGMLEAEDEADMRTKVRERLEEAATQRENNRIETALLDGLISDATLELPGPLLEEQTRGRLESLSKQMTEQGVPEADLEGQLEDARPAAEEEAAKGLKALLIVETIGEKEELLVTREELDGELVNIATRNNTSVEEVRNYYTENNLGQQMAIELLERKVRGFLREHAEVKQPS